MKPKHPLPRLGVVAIAAGLVLSACGGGEDPEGAQPADQQEQSGDSEETLRAAYQYSPDNLDPHTVTGSYAPVVFELFFDTLVHVEADGTLSPGLAEDWEFSEDGSELILTIREDVEFSDGNSLDAETVKVNLDRARGIDFEESALSGDLSMVKDITVDGNEVLISLEDNEGGALPALLSDRAGMIASEESLESSNFDQQPAGAGPYQVTSFDSDSHLNVERWEGYWDSSIDRNAAVEVSFIKDSSSRLRGVQAGQYDWATIDPVQVADAETSDLEIVSNPTYSYNRLTMNRSREWFSDPRVREALSYAVDREALVEGVLFGHGEPAYQPFPEGYWAAVDAEEKPYDPERAKSLLADAGYPDGFSFEAVSANSPAAIQVAEAVAAQLSEVGVDVEIRPVDNSTVTFYANKDSDAWIGPWGGRADPALTLSLQFTKGKLQNPGDTASDEIESAAAEALRPGTEQEREGAMKAFTAQVLEEDLDVFLFFENLTQVHTENVSGVQSWITDKPSFRGVVKHEDIH